MSFNKRTTESGLYDQSKQIIICLKCNNEVFLTTQDVVHDIDCSMCGVPLWRGASQESNEDPAIDRNKAALGF